MTRRGWTATGRPGARNLITDGQSLTPVRPEWSRNRCGMGFAAKCATFFSLWELGLRGEMARYHSWRPGVAAIWNRIHSTADPDSYLLVYVDPFSPGPFQQNSHLDDPNRSHPHIRHFKSLSSPLLGWLLTSPRPLPALSAWFFRKGFRIPLLLPPPAIRSQKSHRAGSFLGELSLSITAMVPRLSLADPGRSGASGRFIPLQFTTSNGVLPTGNQNFALTITRPPCITSVNNATFVVGTAKNLYNYDSEFGAQIDLEFHRYLAERGDLYSAGE